MAVRSPAAGPSSFDRPHPSPRSLRALDWFVFFIADVQTGFGPFIAVYLTIEKWTLVDIGFVMSIAGIVSLLGQVPGGALVDWARSERLVAAVAVAAIGLSALAFALWPIMPIVLLASALHAGASCVLGPAIAAISLGLVGHREIGERFGRNARFASIGAGLSAAVMGACGYFLSAGSVFFATACLMVPALLVLQHVVSREIDPELAHGGTPERARHALSAGLVKVLSQKPLLIFGGCMLLFHLGNAAMLPLMGSVLTTRSSQWATVLIGACMVGPQLVVAAFSPWAGRQARRWGRRPLMLAGFAALPVRGLLFATVTDPYALVVIQLLDGLTAATFGVLVPLTIVDLTRGTGHFNLTQGVIGVMVGLGATLSPMMAGYLGDSFGTNIAFLGLAAAAFVGLSMVWLFIPETRPADDEAPCGDVR